MADIMRSRLRTILSLASGVGFLVALIVYVGPGSIVEVVSQASLPMVFLALTSYLAFFVLRGIRWSMILSPVGEVSVPRTTGYTMVGWLVNTLVPMRAGEFARAGLLAKRDKVPFASGLSTIGVERVLDVLGLAIACAAAFVVLPRAFSVPSAFTVAFHVSWALPILLLGFLWGASRRPAAIRGSIDRTVGRLPGWGSKLARFTNALVDGATSLFSRPRALPAILALTVAMTAAQVAIYTFLLLAYLPGVDPVIAAAGVPFFILSFAIHVTPGNVGTYEAAFIAIFAALGYAPTALAPVSVLTHASTAGFVILLGTLAGVALGTRPLTDHSQAPVDDVILEPPAGPAAPRAPGGGQG